MYLLFLLTHSITDVGEKLMKFYRQMITCLTGIGYLIVILFAVQTFHEAIPEKIYVKAGEAVEYNFDVPVTVVLKDDATEVFENSTGSSLAEHPAYTVTCKLFGVFPVKDVEVMLVEGDSVFASGMQVGIYTKMDGVLVIGIGEVPITGGSEAKPAENLVKKGDYIVSLNGIEIDEKEELASLIDEYGAEQENLGIMRNGEYIEVLTEPVKSAEDTYMLGIWVRDDLAGIGTLTYYTKDGNFGALGHPVSDGDTGEVIDMEEGDLYETTIIGIQKGESGSPGELSGIINYSKGHRIGTIEENTGIGIYGVLDGNLDTMPVVNSYEAAYKQEIQLGKATILSGFTGTVESYEIEIKSLDYSGREANKGILFEVTDPELLELTGGIVQGMSGSPILQNGKIIGAVTHVLVSDPTSGYGIFIENMLEQ